MADHPSSSSAGEPLDDTLAEMLSALADGEAAEAELDQVLAAWARSPALRQRWHSQHLAADVLRSADQRRPGRSDEEFLARFQQQLAQEPVILVPRAMPTPTPEPFMQPARQAARRRWAGPSAVAAGFVLVVGAVVNLVGVPTGQGGDAAAQADGGTNVRMAMQPSSGTGSVVRVTALDDPLNPPVTFQRPANPTAFQLPADMVMIRDPQLDAALAMDRAGTADSGCRR